MSSPHPVFGFGNPETHLLLIWPTEHSGADLKALVAQSMDEVEHDNT